MVLRVEKLCKSFEGKTVLKDLSFEAGAGEILAVCGESGAGKTTLLRCIAGLEEAQSGEITVNGEPRSALCAKEKRSAARQIGLVFQHYELFPHKNILDNLTLAPVLRRQLTKEQARKKARELLEAMGIADKAMQYPHQLSGGQQQRAAIARALMTGPGVLCLDEPTSALDPQSAGEIGRILKNIAAGGICVLLVSHDPAFVAAVADRTLWLP